MIATSFPTLQSRDGAIGRGLFMIIAIDGPAASGKGTLARRIARHFGLPHLDTGLLYRATARALLDEGRDLSDVAAAVAAARGLALIDFDEELLRGARDGRGGLGRRRDAGGPRGAGREPALLRPQRRAARCSTAATSARDLPRGRGEDFRDREPGDAGDAPARSNSQGQASKVDYAAVLDEIRKRDERDSTAQHGAAQAGGRCRDARYDHARRRGGLRGGAGDRRKAQNTSATRLRGRDCSDLLKSIGDQLKWRSPRHKAFDRYCRR